jgi:hypothetical protein
LIETRLDGEEYGEQSEALVPLIAVGSKCQTNTEGTGGNGHGQPQAVAESCDVAIPCHVGSAGQTYKHVGGGKERYCSDCKYVIAVFSSMVTCNVEMSNKVTEVILS